jgi:nucleoside-diphosphate-sugar epimerase
MRIFVTGASGHIGAAVVPELLAAGHEVLGLARSDSAADAIAAMGADVRLGALEDLDGLRAAAESTDGVIHLAFRHDAMRSGDFEGAATSDREAIGAMSEALVGTGKPIAISSGTLLLSLLNLGRSATEADVNDSGPRADAENFVIGLAESDVRSSVVRLTPTVHSSLDHHGFIPALIGFAREQGYAAYVGEGANRWPAVNTLDAARLYRLAVEKAPAGTRLHAVGDDGVPFREIAETIGRMLDVPTKSLSPDEAEAYFSFLALFVQLDNPVSSALTQELMGWTPEHPGLLADLEEGHYFSL